LIIKLILYWCGRLSGKHLESPLISDLKKTEEKVDAGADYVVTQMFFDNAKYFEFVDKVGVGITVPIIPIKPLRFKDTYKYCHKFSRLTCLKI
jgi:5,10-methylenetetrahydrofolate reductase